LERESASSGTLGFDARESGVQISVRLESWQAQNDELLWKFIISPEFGDRTDLQRLTRDLMGGAEEDLGRPLEWVAAIHQNTEFPHVHVALRGVSADGNVLRLSRDYIKRGVREIAEGLCTRQLGYRTTLDASEAECREITQARYTSLGRFIFRHARASDTDLVFNPTSVNDIERNQRISARLVTLSRMGLAERMGDSSWSLRLDTEQVLRSMQRAKDHQKTLSVHGALLSDERLPIEAINWRQLKSVEGRVLVHWQEEHSGKSYLMLESTAAKVYVIPYTPEMEEARIRGELKTNWFVRLRRQAEAGTSSISIEEVGHSEALLTNRRLLREKVTQLQEQDLLPTEDGWGGWLGKYQKALCEMRMDRELRPVGKEVRQRRPSLER
jgi:hypothetical protein